MKDFKKIDLDENLKADLEEKKVVWDPNPEFIKKAYSLICKQWNKNQKSRNFIKHLVAAHLPIDQFSRLFYAGEDKEYYCCILGYRLTGLKNIAESLSEFSVKKMFIDASVMTQERDGYTEEEAEELNKLKSRIPIAAKEGRIAYLSDRSDKVISLDSLIALRFFVLNHLMLDSELDFTLTKSRVNKTFRDRNIEITNKQANTVTKAHNFGLSGVMNKSGIEALKDLKDKLEKAEEIK